MSGRLRPIPEGPSRGQASTRLGPLLRASLVVSAVLMAAGAMSCSGDGFTPPTDACPPVGVAGAAIGYGTVTDSGQRSYTQEERTNFVNGCLTPPADFNP